MSNGDGPVWKNPPRFDAADEAYRASKTDALKDGLREALPSHRKSVAFRRQPRGESAKALERASSGQIPAEHWA